MCEINRLQPDRPTDLPFCVATWYRQSHHEYTGLVVNTTAGFDSFIQAKITRNTHTKSVVVQPNSATIFTHSHFIHKSILDWHRKQYKHSRCGWLDAAVYSWSVYYRVGTGLH